MAETWVEIDAFHNPGTLGYQLEMMAPPTEASMGLRGAKGEWRRTEKLVEGQWLVRWWKRIR